MKVLFYGLAVFFLAVILHVIIWRCRVPKRGIDTLFKIFSGTFLIASLPAVCFLSLPEYIRVLMLYVSLALSYMITYSAVEADSPSVMMVAMIRGSGEKGLDEKSLRDAMTDDVLVKLRVEDLLNDGMINLSGGRYKLTSKGNLFLHPFVVYRKILNLPKGG